MTGKGKEVSKNFILLKHMPFTDYPPHRFPQFKTKYKQD